MTRQLLSLATSAITLYGMWLAGNKDHRGWTVGLWNQAVWFAFIVAFGAWGLLPLNAALVVVYTRNLRAWRVERSETTAEGGGHKETLGVDQ